MSSCLVQWVGGLYPHEAACIFYRIMQVYYYGLDEGRTGDGEEK